LIVSRNVDLPLAVGPTRNSALWCGRAVVGCVWRGGAALVVSKLVGAVAPRVEFFVVLDRGQRSVVGVCRYRLIWAIGEVGDRTQVALAAQVLQRDVWHRVVVRDVAVAFGVLPSVPDVRPLLAFKTTAPGARALVSAPNVGA